MIPHDARPHLTLRPAGPRYTSYPTAPHFKPDITAETYAAWLSQLPPERPLSLYLHVPFCAELRLYCGCHTDRHAAALARPLRAEGAI